MGGDCEILAVGVADGALARAEAWVHATSERFTRFREDSELSRFNASAGRPVAVSEELGTLLRECLRAYEVSGGLVHAGTLPGLLAAGYTRDFSLGGTAPTAPPPPPAPLPELLEVRGRTARLREGAAIDLGGIAKGWMADTLAARLGASCVVNLCGDLYARGGGEEGDGWPIGFGDRTVLATDMGIATSGTTKRSWGPRLHHLIDPRTGRPALSDLAEVSVISGSAADAEIHAKTALLLGREAAEAWLRERALGWSLTTTGSP